MEHLILPSGADEHDIPWLGGFYNRGPFLEYAERARPKELEPYVVGSTRGVLPEYRGEGAHGLEKLFQTWLFFGLLHEFFGSAFDERHFTRYMGPPECPHVVLDTSCLWPTLRQWIARKEANGQHTRDDSSHFRRCFQVLVVFLGDMSSPSFDARLRLMIMTVAELLEFALFMVDNKESPDNMVHKSQILDQFALERMRANNWCMYEASQLAERAILLYQFNFLSRIKRSARGHEHCSKEMCVRSVLTYEQQKEEGLTHRPDCVGCGSVGPSAEDLSSMVSLLLEGEVPVIRVGLTSNSTIEVAVVPFREGMHYTAVSHVWADGLGNPNSNEVAECQVWRLVAILRETRSENRRSAPSETQSWPQSCVDSGNVSDAHEECEEFHVWIDTLCCPVHNQAARLQAIATINTTFARATSTIVLDAELQDIDISKISDLEVVAHIFSCGWSRRLWTFLEETLSENVWIQFRDGQQNLRALARSVIEQNLDPSLPSPACAIVFGMIWELQRLSGDVPERLRGPMQFPFLVGSIKGRVATKPNDEALCLASLLDVDTEAIVQAPKRERAQTFWKCMERSPQYQIPSSIVFYRGPKLEQSGFRWAPKSLREPSINNFVQRGKYEDRKPARLVSGGIRVHLPGGYLTRPQHIPQQVDVDSFIRGGCLDQNNAIIQDQTGRWFNIHTDTKLEKALLARNFCESWAFVVRDRVSDQTRDQMKINYGILASRGKISRADDNTLHADVEVPRIRVEEHEDLLYFDRDTSVFLNTALDEVSKLNEALEQDQRPSLMSCESLQVEMAHRSKRRLEEDDGLSQRLEKLGHVGKAAVYMIAGLMQRLLIGRYALVDSTLETDRPWDFVG
ncbi:MAG: hypothetical protein M1831_005819 [Alyxoria varia]|nr:MAG: hypothetical protein M1831_005819 [Alyxoria varia]